MDLAYTIELAVAAIDANFGEGYAKAHPELISAHLQSVAIYALAAAIRESRQ